MDTKTQILKKARKLFAKQGFEGVSIRTICDKADCNVSAISYHFGSKEELYRACLSEDGMNILQLMKNFLTPAASKEDFEMKLRLFLNQFFSYSMNDRDLILMISKDVNSKLAMESIHKIFHKIPETMITFVKDAQDRGIVRRDICPDVFSDLVTQPLFMNVLFAESARHLKQKNVADPAFRASFIDQQIRILLETIFS